MGMTGGIIIFLLRVGWLFLINRMGKIQNVIMGQYCVVIFFGDEYEQSTTDN